MIRSLLLALSLVLLATPARADKNAALAHYEAGTKAYNLGRFDEAIGRFEQAYESHPSPAFLFNIAQCHRQLDHCEQAVFFYRRYLSEDPETTVRKEVEERIRELEKRCDEQRTIREKPPQGTHPPKDSPPGTAPKTTAGVSTATAPPPRAEVFAVNAEAGVAFSSIGDVQIPAQLSLRLGASLPFHLGSLTLAPGVLVALAPVPYRGEASRTALLTQLLVSFTLGLNVSESLRFRADLGFGALLFSGLDDGNPFTTNGAPTSGALGMFAFRGGVGAEWALSRNVVLSISPFVLSLSPPKAGLREEVKLVQRIDVLAGLGVRL